MIFTNTDSLDAGVVEKLPMVIALYVQGPWSITLRSMTTSPIDLHVVQGAFPARQD